MNEEYYLLEGEDKIGPFSLKELLKRGIDIDTLILTADAEEWQEASYLPEFSDYFAEQGYIFPTEDNLANAGWRTLAFVIDYFIVSIIVMFFATRLKLFTIPATSDPFAALSTLSQKTIYTMEGCLAIVFLLYNILLESTLKGSIGKTICGLKVVDEDGRKLNLVKSFLRNIGSLTAFNIFGLVFLIVSFFYKPLRQTWYERLTKTFMVRTL
jgi:uncharacterized RDD family membrane protein YckC